MFLLFDARSIVAGKHLTSFFEDEVGSGSFVCPMRSFG